jgi:hypothetical protein
VLPQRFVGAPSRPSFGVVSRSSSGSRKVGGVRQLAMDVGRCGSPIQRESREVWQHGQHVFAVKQSRHFRRPVQRNVQLLEQRTRDNKKRQ